MQVHKLTKKLKLLYNQFSLQILEEFDRIFDIEMVKKMRETHG